MQIMITGTTTSQLKAKLEDLCTVFGLNAKPLPAIAAEIARAAPAAPAHNPTLVVHDGVQPAKAKPGRKSNAQKEADAGLATLIAAADTVIMVEDVSDFIDSDAPRVVYTKDQVTDALKKVNSAKGLPTVKAILAEFGQDRLSSIEEKDYPAFIEKCQAALKA